MIYELKIAFKGINPKIERVVMLDSNLSFEDLHGLIMGVTQFQGYHQYAFKVAAREGFNDIEIVCDENDITEAKSYYNYLKSNGANAEELARYHFPDYKVASNTVLSEIFEENKKCIYEYDFGDGWELDITLLKKNDSDTCIIPICLSGKEAAPPEDCGGVSGYKHLLKVLSSDSIKNTEEYNELKSWVHDMKWIDSFDIETANKKIKKLFGKIKR